MKIDRIELYVVQNRFWRPWRTAYGSDAFNRVLMARMVSGEHEGWSESSPLGAPTYCYEYADGAFEIARDFLAPALIGQDIGSARELNERLVHYKGNPFAKAAVEMAWWTLAADCEGKTLGQMIGNTPGEIEVGEGFGIADSFDDLIKDIGGAFDKGYSRVKLKMAHGWDIEMLKAVRSTFPTQRFHVDANSSYDPSDSEDLAILKQVDKFGLAMIEQPFRVGDLYSAAKFQRQIDTPLCLDESIFDVWQAEQAAELKACGYINIKPARVGGIQNSLDINRICEQAGIGCWIGGMMESDVGKSMCVEMAALSNMVYPHDVTPSVENYPEVFTDSVLEWSSPCHFHTSERVGTPIRPDMLKMKEKIAKSAIVGE